MTNPAARAAGQAVRVDAWRAVSSSLLTLPPLASMPPATHPATSPAALQAATTMTSSSGEPQPAEPITSGEPSRRVYGYYRPLNGHAETQQGHSDIRDYASQHGYQLAGTITDTSGRYNDLHRPGITQLLDAIASPDVFGVIIPGRRHLSPDPDILDQLIRRILATGCHLFVVYDGSYPNPDQPQQPRQPLHCGGMA